MKTPIIIALFAVAASAATAGAQTQPNGEGRIIFDALPQSWLGEAPVPASTLPLNLQTNFDERLPALPAFDAERAAGVKLRVVPTSRGQMLQVEASDRSMKDVLQTVTDVWGLRAVIDPALEGQHLTSAVFRAPTPQDLLDIICEFSVKQFKWDDGSLYFVDKVNPDFLVALSENRANDRLEKLIAEREKQKRDADPFYPRFRKPLEAQPGWEKREFNGHEFFFIPAPRAAK